MGGDHSDCYPSPQSMDSEVHSPNEMMVDPDEYVVEAPETEKDDVAIINPDQLNGDTDETSELRADDCMLTPRTLPTVARLADLFV